MPVLPYLDIWARKHLQALVTANDKDALDQAFKSFISEDAKLTLNGESVTPEEYKKRLGEDQILEQAVSINVDNIVLAPELDKESSEGSGSIGIFYTAHFVQSILVLGSAVEHVAQSSINIKVIQDESIQPPTSFSGLFDKRRVAALDQVLIHKAVTPTFPKGK